jgi:hypothetical protein
VGKKPRHQKFQSPQKRLSLRLSGAEPVFGYLDKVYRYDLSPGRSSSANSNRPLTSRRPLQPTTE